MNLKVIRSIEIPIREFPSFEERWRGEDKGLITAWEVGREKSINDLKLKDSIQLMRVADVKKSIVYIMVMIFILIVLNK